MEVTSKYSANESLSLKLFDELIIRYTETGRYYHSLIHIETMLGDIRAYYNGQIPDELFFAAWFHDAVYNALLNNNEAKSAVLAVRRLRQLQVPGGIITKVENLILKTANHFDAEADDEITAVFLDVDLKIMGTDETTYKKYTEAVRKEYSMYPDMLFNRGRKKFIEKALVAKRIFKSDKFYTTYEQQARKNLLTELNQLL